MLVPPIKTTVPSTVLFPNSPYLLKRVFVYLNVRFMRENAQLTSSHNSKTVRRIRAYSSPSPLAWRPKCGIRKKHVFRTAEIALRTGID